MDYYYYVTTNTSTTTVPITWKTTLTTDGNFNYGGYVRYVPADPWVGAIQINEVAEETEIELVDDSEELDEYLDEFAIKAG